jgi:3-oxoacyl-[acyl-carrier protein] reductase
MDLGLKNQYFLVCGAGSGFGRAIAESLCSEGARVLGVSRSEAPLEELKSRFPEQFSYLAGDLQDEGVLARVVDEAGRDTLHGAVINAGGPPVGSALDTPMEEWDKAWRLVVRWKIDLVRQIVLRMAENGYGRLLFVESQTVKQPIPGLVLSNALRMAIAGFAKTLSLEVAGRGVTVNLIAPGSHNTAAIERVVLHRSKQHGISTEEARRQMEAAIPVGRMGEARELASLATWLLSANAGFVTGQVMVHDGGNVKSNV